mmetsp:Transcript_34364/g.74426  ORF Transcript_34364/g.74426 Transcript_34364/m.74426 type:complete len:252 (+) Transcript_34364:209-964(+)
MDAFEGEEDVRGHPLEWSEGFLLGQLVLLKVENERHVSLLDRAVLRAKDSRDIRPGVVRVDHLEELRGHDERGVEHLVHHAQVGVVARHGAAKGVGSDGRKHLVVLSQQDLSEGVLGQGSAEAVARDVKLGLFLGLPEGRGGVLAAAMAPFENQDCLLQGRLQLGDHDVIQRGESRVDFRSVVVLVAHVGADAVVPLEVDLRAREAEGLGVGPAVHQGTEPSEEAALEVLVNHRDSFDAENDSVLAPVDVH